MMSRSVVVQEHPLRRRRLLLAIGLVVLAVFAGGLMIGGFGGLRMEWESMEEIRELRERVVLQSHQLEELKQWQADNQTRREIDGAALEIVRQELAAQQETIAELERGIRFYKSLMAPGELAEGLSIRSVDMVPTDDANRYQFRVLVQQSARKHELMTGSLKVSVLGETAGDKQEYELSTLSGQVPNADIRLRFKYFQAIDGELTLPPGFNPQQVHVAAKTTKPSRADVTKDFPWSVQEKLSHVGQ